MGSFNQAGSAFSEEYCIDAPEVVPPVDEEVVPPVDEEVVPPVDHEPRDRAREGSRREQG